MCCTWAGIHRPMSFSNLHFLEIIQNDKSRKKTHRTKIQKRDQQKHQFLGFCLTTVFPTFLRFFHGQGEETTAWSQTMEEGEDAASSSQTPEEVGWVKPSVSRFAHEYLQSISYEYRSVFLGFCWYEDPANSSKLYIFTRKGD